MRLLRLCHFWWKGAAVMDIGRVCLITCLLLGGVTLGWSAESEVLRPRVPIDQIESARTVTNPFPVTPERLQQGKALFEGKHSVVPATGRMGRGWEWI